jgi:ISXO2-like transposase domain
MRPNSFIHLQPSEHRKALIRTAARKPSFRSFNAKGEVRSKHVPQSVTAENLLPMIEEVVESSAHVMTDTSSVLRSAPAGYKHSTVNHTANEYVRHEDGVCITTNTVEGYFGIIKRGIDGIYHHLGKAYIDQYLREFDFRYNVRRMNDRDRNILAVKKTSGKRLTLREPKAAKVAQTGGEAAKHTRNNLLDGKLFPSGKFSCIDVLGSDRIGPCHLNRGLGIRR